MEEFKCEKCDQEFTSQEELEEHDKQAHSQSETETEEEDEEW